MKSVFEEASSVAKAIEKGWEKAGRPPKFSVTIYENAQKNFLGMTKKPAKVGIFFEDKKQRDMRARQHDPRRRSYHRRGPSRPRHQSLSSSPRPQGSQSRSQNSQASAATNRSRPTPASQQRRDEEDRYKKSSS